MNETAELTVKERCAIAEEMTQPDFIEKYAALKRENAHLKNEIDHMQKLVDEADQEHER